MTFDIGPTLRDLLLGLPFTIMVAVLVYHFFCGLMGMYDRD